MSDRKSALISYVAAGIHLPGLTFHEWKGFSDEHRRLVLNELVHNHKLVTYRLDGEIRYMSKLCLTTDSAGRYS